MGSRAERSIIILPNHVIVSANGKTIMNTTHVGRMRCPICDAEIKNDPLKRWNFNVYEVSKYLCDKCGNRFNFYSNPDGKSYTIPKSKQ
jgi:transposase-like protein